MSNVLIGIIGVIFFIGLALAGASYVGALVTDGTTQRDAAVATMSLQQTAGAVKIYNMRQRQWVPNSLTAVDTMISARVLKTRPTNPTLPGGYPIVVDANGHLSAERPAYVAMYLGQSEQAMNACIEIEIQNNNLDRTDPAVMSQPISFIVRKNHGKGGCARMDGGFNVAPNGGVYGDYLAWVPI